MQLASQPKENFHKTHCILVMGAEGDKLIKKKNSGLFRRTLHSPRCMLIVHSMKYAILAYNSSCPAPCVNNLILTGPTSTFNSLPLP